MSVKKFTYPLKGNNDVSSIRTKETALEAFLNSLSLSDDPDDPNHNHDTEYAEIGHLHPSGDHEHDQYLQASEGVSPPVDPDLGDVWIHNESGIIEEVNMWTSNGWVDLLGGGGGGGGPHSRHPDRLIIFESTTDQDKWRIEYNPTLGSLDFTWVG